jgi:predicted kinase
VPRLVLIHGVPGSGKSTLARRYAQDHPLTLVLDIDVVRGLLGAWAAEPERSGVLARTLALAMARTHLGEGHDVVVPQFLGRPDLAAALEALATGEGATFVEVVLVVDPDLAAARCVERAARPQRSPDREACLLLERQGGPGRLRELAERLGAVLAVRPGTSPLAAGAGVEETYTGLRAILGS